jgi:hypothetical protein
MPGVVQATPGIKQDPISKVSNTKGTGGLAQVAEFQNAVTMAV